MLLLMTLFDSFLWLSNNNSIAYMYHSFFIHSFVDGHLGCFHVVAVINCATKNIELHVSFLEFLYFLNICPGGGLLDHVVALL